MTQPPRDSKGRFAKPNKNFLYIVCILIVLGLLCAFHAIGYYEGVKATKEISYDKGFKDGCEYTNSFPSQSWGNRFMVAPSTTYYAVENAVSV